MKIEEHDIDTLADIIRKVDRNHSLGAGALAEAIQAELQKQLPWGCTVDLEPGQKPDNCVIDTADHILCVYAKRGMSKHDCEYWKQYNPEDY